MQRGHTVKEGNIWLHLGEGKNSLEWALAYVREFTEGAKV